MNKREGERSYLTGRVEGNTPGIHTAGYGGALLRGDAGAALILHTDKPGKYNYPLYINISVQRMGNSRLFFQGPK